jgi:putative addiction module component (TIGR02574 family)
MHDAAQRLLQEAMTLPVPERADLAAELLASLDPTVDDDAELLWQQEIGRRVSALEAGTAVTVPWEEVHARLRARLDGTR